MSHEVVEKNIGLMMIMIVIVISIAGLVEILPLVFQKDLVGEPIEGVKPYDALALEGRDIYVREGCYLCHSQQIRPFVSETERYGPYSVAGESVYDRPFQWGSKRTGPDLARVGGRYTDDWHRIHFMNPRDLVPESNMPGFPWLAENGIDGEITARKMRRLRMVGDPYTDEQIAAAPKAVEGKTELDALIHYLQGLGLARSGR
ncbi:MAG: cytochrome-c oxidase, cbb3-type subunit II [Proteobacteria bacterium]|nr:cytochrome-c oxidase, cbb3-type subunit II [Pseudomonadota bacterium]